MNAPASLVEHGLAPLREAIVDSATSEIAINPDGRAWIERHGDVHMQPIDLSLPPQRQAAMAHNLADALDRGRRGDLQAQRTVDLVVQLGRKDGRRGVLEVEAMGEAQAGFGGRRPATDRARGAMDRAARAAHAPPHAA